MDKHKIFRGILTGYDKAFIIDENTKNNLLSVDFKNKDIIKPLVRGKDIKKYRINYKNLYLILTSIGVPIENYPSIKRHLNQYQERLEKRYDKGKHWWELRACNYYKEFEKEKIMWGNLSIGPNFAYCSDELYATAPANFLVGEDLKYLLSILNSKITFFIFKLIGVKVDSGFSEWKKNRVEQLPIYTATQKQQQPFIEKAENMLELNCQLQEEVDGFKHWIEKEFNVDKLSKKLDKYYELDDAEEFIREMKKKGVNTKSRKIREYLEHEFNESLAIVRPLYYEVIEFLNIERIILVEILTVSETSKSKSIFLIFRNSIVLVCIIRLYTYPLITDYGNEFAYSDLLNFSASEFMECSSSI